MALLPAEPTAYRLAGPVVNAGQVVLKPLYPGCVPECGKGRVGIYLCGPCYAEHDDEKPPRQPRPTP